MSLCEFAVGSPVSLTSEKPTSPNSDSILLEDQTKADTTPSGSKDEILFFSRLWKRTYPEQHDWHNKKPQ